MERKCGTARQKPGCAVLRLITWSRMFLQMPHVAWDVIRGLVRGCTTLLLTTQYLEEADQLADTVAVIDHGRILTNDTPANLKNQLGRERLDIKLADPADMTRIPMLRMKALPTEIQNGALSFALSEGESGLREAASILQQLMASRVGFLYDFCYG